MLITGLSGCANRKGFCGVLNCSSSTSSCPNLKFFQLPQHRNQPQRRVEWLKKIGRPDIKPYQSLLVCEKHFTKMDFTKHAETKKLVKYSIPSQNLPESSSLCFEPGLVLTKPKHVYQRTNMTDKKSATVCQEVNVMGNNEPQKTDLQINNEEQDFLKKLPANSSEHKVEVEVLTNMLHQCNRLRNKGLEHVIKLFLKLRDNTKPENTTKIYSDQYKSLIVQLYLANSQAYEALQSILCLPPISTLPDFIPLTVESINEGLNNKLKAKSCLMSKNQKYAILCVNKIKLKGTIEYDYELDVLRGCVLDHIAPGQCAFIAMVRGLTTEWHQVVSLFVGSQCMFKEFNIWINNLIKCMSVLGINIKLVIHTYDDFFVRAFQLRYHAISGSKVYYLVDPRYIMLLLYEELKNNVVIDDYKNLYAKWEDISKFFELDSTRSFRLTHRSTDINPEESLNKKLESAAQILSINTVSGIAIFVDLKLLDKNAMKTADFLFGVNEIFTCVYPNALPPERRAKENKIKWQEIFNVLLNISNLYCTNQNKKKSPLRSMQFFSRSIENISSMMNDMLAMLTMDADDINLKEEYTSKSILTTQNLNQDPLVDYIDNINLKYAKNLTANELNKIIRGELIFENCQMKGTEEENNVNMENFIDIAKKIIELPNCFDGGDESERVVKRRYHTDFEHMDHEDAKSLFFVATYLLDKMYEQFKSSVSARIKFLNSSVHYESREGLIGSIIIPDNEFLQSVYNMDYVFVNGFKGAMASGKLFEDLMKQMNQSIVTVPFEKGPLEYIKGLFVSLRIYQTIKCNNYIYEKGGTETQEFVLCPLDSEGVNLKISKNAGNQYGLGAPKTRLKIVPTTWASELQTTPLFK